MAVLAKQVLEKLNLRSDEALCKTTELLHSLEQNYRNLDTGIGEYGKVVVCADIAADLLNFPKDEELFLRVSGMRKANYVKNKLLFQKLLDVNQTLGLTDICVKLGVENYTKAKHILELFKTAMAESKTEIDITHPQYGVMAVYLAHKSEGIKISKSKLLNIANLRPSQWENLEQIWRMVLPSEIFKDKKTNNISAPSKRVLVENRAESYEIWKARLIKRSEESLANQ